jgi:hypothetical protein
VATTAANCVVSSSVPEPAQHSVRETWTTNFFALSHLPSARRPRDEDLRDFVSTRVAGARFRQIAPPAPCSSRGSVGALPRLPSPGPREGTVRFPLARESWQVRVLHPRL